jgi:hypothetical protein
MKQRLAPFLLLLEARYAPLLFAVAPQSYSVYLWLFPLPYSLTGEVFAVLGALGFEFVYVGAIAWAEEGKAGMWTWVTAAIALLFSVAVAYYVYRSQEWWALLHAGFPLVAFGYTMQLHGMRLASNAPVMTAVGTITPDPVLLPPLSKTERVKLLASELNVSESTVWRLMKAGTVTPESEERSAA